MLFKIKRIVALAIDIALSLFTGFIILALLFYLLSMLGFGLNINLTKYSQLIAATAFVLGYISLNSYFLNKYQASVGKRAMGLKIIGVDSLYAKLFRTLLPVVALYLNIWFAFFALLNFIIGLGPKNLSGHDYLFKTQVVGV